MYEEHFLLRTLETVLYLAAKFHIVYIVCGRRGDAKFILAY
jgi:hypothetical protein